MKNLNETNIVINHTSRSKAGMNEDFATTNYDRITLGRSASCDIAFDPDADNMVSRHHATIQALHDGTFRYQVIDENSTNGVLVNGQKIKGMAVLVPGDTIQLGRKGPEFKFDLNPRPDVLLSKTRVMTASTARTTVQESTRVQPTAPASDGSFSLSTKATRLIGAVAAGIFIAIVAFSTISWDTASPVQPVLNPDTSVVVEKPAGPTMMNASQIASAYKEAVVYINNSWKLENYQGKQMYHRYTLVEYMGQNYVYPCYIRNAEGGYEPFIEPFNYQGYSKPIGGQGAGTGFVVSEDGFILTNKHVSAPWDYTYRFEENAFPGLEVNSYGELMVHMDTSYITVKANQVQDWIPTEAYYGSQKDGHVFEGTMVYQDVIFADRTGRHTARVTRVSDKHDVALLKVDIGSKLKTVPLHDDYNEVASGKAVSILGYPALTPKSEKVEAGYGPGTSTKVRVVPNLAINQGIISAVHKGSTSFDASSLTRSQFGDAYQLTINSAGGGNSGGPMFDEYGRVTGIFFYGMSDYTNTISFAIPIKYGIELLSL